MEGLKKIAVRFYNESSEAEKQKIDEIFREVDSDGDGKVTFKELKDSGLFTNELSTILDLFGREERNGILDFDEFVILFLHMFEPVIQILGKYLPGSRNCDVCGRRQGLADFSCFFCLGKSPDSYDMCYDCHESGAYSDHEHGEEWCILNHESLALLEFFRHGLVSAHFVQESTPRRTIHVPAQADSSAPTITDMISGDLLHIEPLKLQFPFFRTANVVLGKSSCSLRVTNNSSYHVVLLVTGISRRRFYLKPVNRKVLLPHSTMLLSAYMFLPKNFPLAIEGNEKFFIHSVVVSPEFANEDITAKMFGKEPGNWVKECELEVVNVSFPAPRDALQKDSPTKASSELLHIEPQELRFPYVLGKASSCSVRLTNKSDYQVRVWVYQTNVDSFDVSDTEVVMLPHSTRLISVNMKPPREAPLDMECSDKFFIQSAPVSPAFTETDLAGEAFNMESAHGLEECELRAVYMYVPPSSSEWQEQASIIKASVDVTHESIMARRKIYVPVNISERFTAEMITGNLLRIEPLELQFPFFLDPKVVLGKRSSCSLKLTNESDYHVAIKMSSICKQLYSLDPSSREVLSPHSTMLLTVSIYPPTKAPLKDGDKFHIYSVIVSPGLGRNYITTEMFGKESRNCVEQCVLKALYVNVPSAKEGPEEVPPKMAPIDMGTSNLQIKPQELLMPFVLGKASSCPVLLTNNSNDHVGVKVLQTNIKDYTVWLDDHIISPHSTKLISVYMEPPQEVPKIMQSRDWFGIYCVKLSPELTEDDLTDEMFKMEPGNGVEKCVLRIFHVYVPPSDDGPTENSFVKALVDKESSKVQRTIYAPVDISARLNVEMMTGNLLQIEPLVIQFQILSDSEVSLGKKGSCSLQLTNKYNYHVAFQVKDNSMSEYEFNPHEGVLLPHSTVSVIIETDEPPEEDLFGMAAADTISIYSVVVDHGCTEKDISEETFKTKSGNWIERCDLKVVPTQKEEGLDDEEDDDSPMSLFSDDTVNLFSELFGMLNPDKSTQYICHI